MFCTNCGAPIEDGNLFCVNCGTRVEGVAEGEEAESIEETAEEIADGASIYSAEEAFTQETENAAEDIAEEAVEETAEEIVEGSSIYAAEDEFAQEVANPPASDLDIPSNESAVQLTDDIEQIENVEVAPLPEQTMPAQQPPVQQMPVIPPMPAQTPAAAASIMGQQMPGQVAPGQPMQPMQPMQQAPVKKGSNKGLIIAIIAVVVVIAGILAYVFAIGPAMKAAKEYDVQLVTAGSALDSATTTPVAIGIKGTVLSDNSAYEETVYFTGSDTVKLHEGSYTATVLAPVIASDGTLINFTPATANIQVTEQGGSQQVLFTAAPVANDQLTTELVSKAATIASQAGVDQTTLKGYVDKAQEKQAQADKAAREAEAKRIAEEAERKKAEEEAKAHTAGATWYVCASDFVTMRVSPSTSARAITRINSRVAVTYLGDAGGGWVRISYNGREGYVLARFVSYDKNHPLDYGDV